MTIELKETATRVSVRPKAGAKPTARDYAGVGAFLILTSCVMVMIVRAGGSTPARDQLLAPMAALVGLIGVVWLLMGIVRNVAVMRGRVDARRYIDYEHGDIDERIERPGRTFNNLFQVPVLFYVACLAMMITERIDAAQLRLCWLFVGLRALHAVVYIGWNHLPTRFAAFVASCLVLWTIWGRLVWG